MKKNIIVILVFCTLNCTSKNLFSMHYPKTERHQLTANEQQLHYAVTKDKIRSIAKLLQNGTNPNSYYPMNQNHPQLAQIARLVHMQPQNIQNAYLPLVMIAAGRKNLPIIKLLVESGAYIDAPLKIEVKKKHPLDPAILRTGPTTLKQYNEHNVKYKKYSKKTLAVYEYLIFQRGISTEDEEKNE